MSSGPFSIPMGSERKWVIDKFRKYNWMVLLTEIMGSIAVFFAISTLTIIGWIRPEEGGIKWLDYLAFGSYAGLFLFGFLYVGLVLLNDALRQSQK